MVIRKLLTSLTFTCMVFLFSLLSSSAQTQRKGSLLSYDQYPFYPGDDLEMVWTPEETHFRIWSPVAEAAEVRIYKSNEHIEPIMVLPMSPDVLGTWVATFKGNLLHHFYTFRTKHAGAWLLETPGIYAKAVGVNGTRAYIFDPSETYPEGWENDRGPQLLSPVDAVIYELHLRDISIHPSSGIVHKGKFLGLAEAGTKNLWNQSTGLDHLKELGITHVHILPMFDFHTIDESRLEDNEYNWGYDPQNYNAPEGSYATNPFDPVVRNREMRQMVMALHQAGIGVVMDVVYNHTFDAGSSNFNQLVPGYYYRHNPDGSYSNASGCGNETASERPMVRQYIIESVKYWAKEYHIDGFRFDLMAIHDIETMNQIRQALLEINPNILIYGEGWTAGDSPLPFESRALKNHVSQMPGIAVFSDDLRDAVKGPWYNDKETGFVGGIPGLEESIKFGIVAATRHPQINYQAVNYSKSPYASGPEQCINYVSCHDNHTLWDKTKLTIPNATQEELVAINKLASAIVLTSQGIPFLHNGVEMMRSKKGVENSYNSPDSINQIDWNWKFLYKSSVEFHRKLIEMRKQHPAFRMRTQQDIEKNLEFFNTGKNCVVAYTINGAAVGDSWKRILVVFNGNRHAEQIPIPAGNWKVILNGDHFMEAPSSWTNIPALNIMPSSAMILAEMD
ncbi:MAG: pullulanase [Bacteroidales bacterium]|nr:pullulanase [Bacteroidales bacterium]MDN5329035.1 pullulanase [Bacteroidales bacterium]